MKTSLKHSDGYMIIPFWILLFLVMWLQILPQTESIIEATLYPIITLISVYPVTTYLSETLLQKAMMKKTVTVFIFQFLGLSIVVGLICSLILYVFHLLEVKGFFPQSEYFSVEVPFYYIFVFLSSGLAINMCICGVRFFQENTKLKKNLIEHKLQTLQHQVTPHFMFNVLNHIHILMQTDVSLASDLLIKYSEILRYQLYKGNKQEVMIEEDLKFLQDFISLEEIRWEEKLTVKTSWEMENPKKKIPALLFITFIENAFKHVPKSDFETGYIYIDFKQTNDTICLNVENSKSALTPKPEKVGGLGLMNIIKRLDILYYGNYSLLIKETNNVYRTELQIKN